MRAVVFFRFAGLVLKVADNTVKSYLMRQHQDGYAVNSTYAPTVSDLIDKLSAAGQNALPINLLPGFYLNRKVSKLNYFAVY